MEYVLPPPPQASVAVDGTAARFALRRVFCVGRNYAAHAREMGADEREAPFFFCKPADAVVDGGGEVPFPPACEELHFEGELVVAIGVGGADIAPARASEHVWGYAAGIDLTRRDLQAAAKAARRPWDMAKGFDQSAPVAPLVPRARADEIEAARLVLRVNGAVKQAAGTDEMIWGVAEIISHLSGLVTLAPGDLIFTGTPAGVGPVNRGDRIDLQIGPLAPLTVTIT